MLFGITILVLWYSLFGLLSRFAGTCTMGDTDRFVAGLVLGVPAAAAAAVLIGIYPPRSRRQVGVVLATTLLASLALCLWIPLAFSAGIQGHHLCGAEFDEYLVGTTGWERLIPLAHVGVAAALLATALRGAWRAWSTVRI